MLLDGTSLTGADEMESLAMSILHDLRSPLAAIYSGAELLKSSPLPDHQVRQLGRSIYNASVRMKDLLEDYIEQYRIREMQPQVSNLGSPGCERGRQDRGYGGSPIRRGDSGHSRGSVYYRAPRAHRLRFDESAGECPGRDARWRIDSYFGNSRGDSVVVRVLDAGPGVAPEIRDRLFQPFVTARKSNGWGLGLASHARS